MIDKLISFVLAQRLFFSIIFLTILGFGVKAYIELPVDAFPEISPTQVKIIMKSDGMTPEEVESKIVIPIESVMAGIPKKTTMRSLSKYGLCDVTIDFEEGTDIYWARSQVNEKLANIKDMLPTNIEGGVAPISTPLGDILMFTIESDKLSLMEKRTLLDWVIAPKIRSISGVAEVNALGGEVKTYDIVMDTNKMEQFGISYEQLSLALKQNNQNEGIGRVTQGGESILVRSVGKLQTLEEIANVNVVTINNRAIKVGDVAQVRFGNLNRAGFVTKNGEGEAVEGLVMALKGANTTKVLQSVKEELTNIEKMLPHGATIDIFYDRGELVDLATSSVKKTLIEAVILIIIILLIMLGNVASAISVALILPFALMMSFLAMQYFGLSANLMSLGGLSIAIGILVDSAVVMVEHITAELGEQKNHHKEKIKIIYQSAVQMSPSIITGVLIIIIVFLPLLTLEGLEGKLFKPVALSIVFALVSSLILALTLIPILTSFILKKREDKESFVVHKLIQAYKPSLIFAIKHSNIVILSVIFAFILSLYFAYITGKSFMPTMDEGSIIIGIETPPSNSIEESKRLNLILQKKLLQEVPEIADIIARSGSDELGLDPMSLNDTDTFLRLKPKEQWENPSKEAILEKIRKVLDGFKGVNYSFTQPIEMRVSEMLTGVRGDLAIDIFGTDNAQIELIATKIKTILENIQGSSDVYKKANEGVEYFELHFNDEMMGHYGVSRDEISSFIKSMVSGQSIGIIQEDIKRIDMVMRGDKEFANSLQKIENMRYQLPNQEFIALSNLVTFVKTNGAVGIEHENGYRKSVVQTNIEGRDLVGFVDEAKSTIEKNLKLPAGYYLTYGGEFENQQRATAKLGFIVPIALALIFILLFLSFGSLTQASLVLINVPLALIGGFIGLYFSGEYFSVPAMVGFIALLGIAVLNGVVLVNYFNELVNNGYSSYDAVINGSIKRLRPVLMTALITMLGLIPLLLADGVGSEIQKPLAIVVINGLISSTLLTLLILPILYLKFSRK
jgi:cobalt-zinc-cadmium resistance protein CzcA